MESQGWPWFILSAKHGLLDPERMTEPYDKTLNTMGAVERREWAETVMDALHPRLAGVRSVVIFAGEVTDNTSSRNCVADASKSMCRWKGCAKVNSWHG